MRRRERDRFDGLLEEALGKLPAKFRAMMDEVALIVEDRPTAELVEQLLKDWGEDGDARAEDESELTVREAMFEDLCGLHSGIALTERSVEHSADLPEEILIFREGIVNMAGGWEEAGAEAAVAEEIRITLLHEIGHHFGLDEDDLTELGYD